MKNAILFLTLLTFFGFSANVGAFPVAHLEQNPTKLTKITEAKKQCLEDFERRHGCEPIVKRCLNKAFGTPNWPRKQLKREFGKVVGYDFAVAACMRRADYKNCKTTARQVCEHFTTLPGS